MTPAYGNFAPQSIQTACSACLVDELIEQLIRKQMREPRPARAADGKPRQRDGGGKVLQMVARG
jgi:hypothetical protein